MKNVGLIFGGKSFEHDVSIKSAVNVFGYLNSNGKNGFEAFPVYVDKNGFFHDEKISRDVLEKGISCGDLPFESHHADLKKILEKADLFFPLIHGRNGEDGNLQGFLEFMGKKYVGSKTLSSALCMDKASSKDILASHRIKQARYFYFFVSNDFSTDVKNCEEEITAGGISFPVFIKPSRTGSSIGISKIDSLRELGAAIKSASFFDEKIIVEEGIVGREIECAAVECDGKIICTVPGEIDYSSSFYDYGAKYESKETILRIPAVISEEKSRQIKYLCEKVFRLFGLKDYARVDFFLNPDGEVLVNEINTIPGFTDNSMFPLLIRKSGYVIEELLSNMINSYF